LFESINNVIVSFYFGNHVIIGTKYLSTL